MDLLEFLRLFFKGALLDSSVDKLRARAAALDDAFMMVVFSELVGIPNPFFYYFVELLPYVYRDFEGWRKRLKDKRSVISRAIGEFGEP